MALYLTNGYGVATEQAFNLPVTETTMTDVEMDAGPECDVAVAEACGIKYTTYCDGPVWTLIDGVAQLVDRQPTRGFHPSTDWNDAMYAAEKFGLFKDRMLGRDGPYWQVVNVADEPAEGSCFLTSVADALTGPLAICRAILALHARGATGVTCQPPR